MFKLSDEVIGQDGGIGRWREASVIEANGVYGGLLWEHKGVPDFVGTDHIVADIHRQHIRPRCHDVRASEARRLSPAAPTWPTQVAAGRLSSFHGRMSESSHLHAVRPNVVLRGGPLDGEQVHVDGRQPIGIEVGDARVVYRPSIELDGEFPTLTIWVFDHATPV
jgi:hypothetical protein